MVAVRMQGGDCGELGLRLRLLETAAVPSMRLGPPPQVLTMACLYWAPCAPTDAQQPHAMELFEVLKRFLAAAGCPAGEGSSRGGPEPALDDSRGGVRAASTRWVPGWALAS